MNDFNDCTQAVPVPDSIGRVAVISTGNSLVELSIKQWTGFKKDKKATAQVEAANNTEAGVVSSTKKLLGNCVELKAIKDFVANARNKHYLLSLPWDDIGTRLLSTTNFFEYNPVMDGERVEFYKLVKIFLDVYDHEVIEAQLRLGGLFNRNEYPSREALAGKFEFAIHYSKVPECGDDRVDEANEQIDEIKKHYEKDHSRQLGNAMNEVWQRAYKTLTHMSERLGMDANKLDKDGNPKWNTFHDSMIDHAVEMVELLKTCNITNDPVMDKLARKLGVVMHGVTPDQLRNNELLRDQTKQLVDKAIADLPTLDF
jgi:hypothetical protein